MNILQKAASVAAHLTYLTLSVSADNASKDWQYTLGATATQARAQWQQIAKGDDLARGKVVRFYPQPNYPSLQIQVICMI